MIFSDNNLTDEERREKLKDLLFELSDSEDLLKKENDRFAFYKKFLKVYIKSDGTTYRHFYSDIFQVISQIDEESYKGTVEVLLQNIAILIKNNNKDSKTIIDGKDIDGRKMIYSISVLFPRALNKLYDHINLEIERMNYSKQQAYVMRRSIKTTLDAAKGLDATFSQRHNDLETQLKDNKSEMESIKEDMHRQQKEMQQEYVAILGIFASIVLAFVGGLTFSTSVLKYINAVSVHRLIVMVSIIGATTFDIIWLLTFFIYKIAINRDNNVNKILMGVLGGINVGFLIAIVSTVVHYLKFK